MILYDETSAVRLAVVPPLPAPSVLVYYMEYPVRMPFWCWGGDHFTSTERSLTSVNWTLLGGPGTEGGGVNN